jgi:hypothetical protein
MNATKTVEDWQLQMEGATTLGELRQLVASAKLVLARNEIGAETLTGLTKKFNDETARRQAAAKVTR